MLRWPVPARRPWLKIWRRLHRVAVLRSASTITRSMKSGPGRCSREAEIVSQRCSSRSVASSPSRSVTWSKLVVVAIAGSPCSCPRRLWGELHGDYVAVSHDVVPSLQTKCPAIACACIAPSVAQGVPADDLGAHEASLDVGMDQAGGVPYRQPATQMPGLGGLV